MMHTALLIATLALQSTPTQALHFVEKLPQGLAEFKMVKVPDGQVIIEGKTHEIKDLYFAETEVTWDVYDVFFLAKDLTEEQQAKRADAENRPSRPYGIYDRGFGHNGYPAIGIHHHSAVKFCEWLSKMTGKKYRLPTEAEWLYAGIAGGTPEPDLEKVAWYWENADDVTHPVAKKQANPWGLYDMLGNASEWCTSLEDDTVTRGGSFRDKADVVNFFKRVPYDPMWQNRDSQIPKSKWWLADADFVGFRVVCEAK